MKEQYKVLVLFMHAFTIHRSLRLFLSRNLKEFHAIGKQPNAIEELTRTIFPLSTAFTSRIFSYYTQML